MHTGIKCGKCQKEFSVYTSSGAILVAVIIRCPNCGETITKSFD